MCNWKPLLLVSLPRTSIILINFLVTLKFSGTLVLEEISHPSYATSVGLVLRGLKANNFEDIQDESTSVVDKSKPTFFENWSKTFLNFLLNE